MLRLPLLYALDRQQEVWVLGDISRHVDHTGGTNKLPRTDLVDAILGKIFAADPMDGRIKVCSRVLAGLKAVPVPGRTAIVIT